MAYSASVPKTVRHMDNLAYRVAGEITNMIVEAGLCPNDRLPPMAGLEARFMVSHLMEFRSFLEPEAAAVAAQRRNDDDLRAMEACLRQMGESPALPDGYAYAGLEFHQALMRATHNPILIAVMNSFDPSLAVVCPS